MSDLEKKIAKLIEKEKRKEAAREKRLRRRAFGNSRFIRWERLDNTANLFPTIAGENTTNVYRLSYTLKEEVDPKLLQKALDLVLPRIDSFNVRLRRGLFWYYFEENGKPAPFVDEERKFPCRFIRENKNNSYLFRVSYYKCRINLEVFHVLSDGMGGVTFLRELLYQYLRLAHPQLQEEMGDALNVHTSLNHEDSFIRHFKKAEKRGFKTKKAFCLKLDKLPAGEFGIMHGYLSVSQLKEVCKRYDASINEYLTAVTAYAIYRGGMKKYTPNRPIRIAVPVNLRPYYDSITNRNFFVMVSAEFQPEHHDHTFEDVLGCIRDSLRRQIQKDHLEKLFSYSVSNQTNVFLRPVPLFIKNPVIRLVYEQSAYANTTTLTNVGNLMVDPHYEPYVENASVCIAMSAGQELKGAICSFGDTLTYTFSTTYSDTRIEEVFFTTLAKEGIDVTVETNQVF